MQGASRRGQNALLDLVERHLRVHAVHDVHAAGQLALLPQAPIKFDALVAQVSLRQAGDAHRIVIREQHLQAPEAVLVGGGLVAGVDFDEAAATAKNAGRLAVRVALDASRLSVRDLKILVDAAEFQRQRVDGRVRAGAEINRVSRRRRIQLGARGEALVPQTSDEDLRERDPLPLLSDGRARLDVP